ncbi:hypothetical protein Y032_0585g321 [Ancylostoma ceylanicum]|uniref:BPTI/Kunitz inhibitor domain-containing protein n=1 Tax=Ancylostoma ceylanicum TaxID=53326 RepID=A0A016WP61_9BILA|nr:hypothetical protein Y032_0585g321 [Ancylostoma ceylanicum]
MLSVVLSLDSCASTVPTVSAVCLTVSAFILLDLFADFQQTLTVSDVASKVGHEPTLQNPYFRSDRCLFVNPCNQPIPLPPQMCSASGPDTCGPNAWCHVGATPETTLCCPSEGDPCSLPLNRGTGNQFMDRWYFNPQSGSCQPFTYAGLHGNQNNFLTREACEQRCGPNPCFEGRPFVGVDGRSQTCSISANLNTCPANYWCHIGADMTTTVCCPGASTNICNLPMSTGDGNYNLERFYFDQSSKTCRPFIYNGLKGNQNNFITLRACQLACQPLDNPCIGQPATTAAGQVLFCSSTNKDTCPVNFWCHIGATPETTVCCPGATNACSVPLAPGTGNSGLSRWYYNPDDRGTQVAEACYACPQVTLIPPFLFFFEPPHYCSNLFKHLAKHQQTKLGPPVTNSSIKQCLPFQYNGKRGNQNNFESQAECERTCPVFVNPCLGDVGRDENAVPLACSPVNPEPCPSGFFCLPGDPAVKNSSFCCPRINQDPCDSSWTEGEGEDSFERYYYNPVEGDCYPFKYKGRKGNENNFLTKKMCQEKCKPIATVCFGGELPLESPSGPVVQCHSQPCPDSHYCHLGKDVKSTVCCEKKGSPCDQQLMLGVGDTSLPRFYYDIIEDDCLPFNYTGIGGNENNFPTRAQCLITCPGYRGYCPHGKPHIVGGVMTQCGIDTSCPVNHVCHVSRRNSRSICCPDPAQFCVLERDPGPCTGNLTRYGYDTDANVCRKFSCGEVSLTGHCFRARHKTLKTVTHKAVHLESAPSLETVQGFVQLLLVGPGYWPADRYPRSLTLLSSPHQAWLPLSLPAFNPGSSTTIQNLTCFGWTNIICFDNIADQMISPFPCFSAVLIVDFIPEELCLLSIDRGACGGRQTRYAFNRQTSQCVPFDYTGCGGNLNNFVSMMDCMATCGNVGFRR